MFKQEWSGSQGMERIREDSQGGVAAMRLVRVRVPNGSLHRLIARGGSNLGMPSVSRGSIMDEDDHNWTRVPRRGRSDGFC